MNIQELLTSIKPYSQQSQSQLWLLAIVVLAVVIIVSVSYTLYDSLKQISFTGNADQNMRQTLNATSESTINQLTQSPLFGSSDQAATTHINTTLTLLGVMSSNDLKRARAIIGSQGREAIVYKINDEIADGGRLRSIHPDRVVFERGGRFETLYLDWNKRTSKSTVLAPSTTDNSGAFDNTDNALDNDDVTGASVAAPPPPPAPEQPTTNIQTPEAWQERLKEIRQKYQNQIQINKPSEYVPAPTPFSAPGKSGTYRINRGL